MNGIRTKLPAAAKKSKLRMINSAGWIFPDALGFQPDPILNRFLSC